MMNRKFGIHTHVVWFTLMPMLIMLLAMEAFFLHERYIDLDHSLIMRGQLIARQVAASSEYGIFSDNRLFLKGVAESALQQPDVKGVTIFNAAQEVLVSSGEMPAALADKKNGLAGNLLEWVGPEKPLFDNGRMLFLYQPIQAAQVELNELEAKPAVQMEGAVVLEMNWAQTRRMKFHLLWLNLSVAALFLLITMYLMHLASRRIIQPIKKLSEAMHLIGAGNLETRVTVPGSIHELIALTNGMNQMTTDLQHERTILQQRIEEATLQLRNLAFYDTLTLLPNRRLLNDRLTQALAASARSGHYGALMFLDLDNFKSLNDQFGHAVGDLLLIEAARRISSCLREMDTVARFGGDEFVVMLSHLDVDETLSVLQAQRVAEKIRMILAETYHLVRHPAEQSEIRLEHHCTSSIGVVLFLDHDASEEQLMSWADAAMYQAKKEGRNRICFYLQATIAPPVSAD